MSSKAARLESLATFGGSLSSAVKEVIEIGAWHFPEEIDILASIEVVEAGNSRQVIARLQNSDAGYAAEIVRRSILANVLLRVARAYSPTRSGDRHLQRAFELLQDEETFGKVAEQGNFDLLTRARDHWIVNRRAKLALTQSR